jgi:hypothetical protein
VETVPVLTKSLRQGDVVLAYKFPGSSNPRSLSRAVTAREGAYDSYGGTVEVVVAYTTPVVGRTKYDKAGRDVVFQDGRHAQSIASATWLRVVPPDDAEEARLEAQHQAELQWQHKAGRI